MELTQGRENESVDASKRQWHLARLVKASPTLQNVFEELHPTAMLAALEHSQDGRAFLPELRRYLDGFAWRSDALTSADQL